MAEYSRKVFRILALVVIVIACTRKDDNTVIEPVVNLLLPTEFMNFSYGDTINISVTISHIKLIKNVAINITNDELKPVVSGKHLNIGKEETGIETYLIVDNKYIDEGKFYLHLEVEDNDNLFNFWYPVSLNKLERSLENIFIVTGDSNINNLSLVRKGGYSEMYFTWNSEYNGGYIDSRYRRFYTSGSIVGGIRAYSLDDKEIKWTVPSNAGGNLPYFTSFNATDGFINTAIWTGYIDSYNQDGNKLFTSTVISNGKYLKLLKTRDFIYSVFMSFDNQSTKLIVFNYPAGNVYYSIDLNGDVLYMNEIKDGKIMLLISKNGKTGSWQFNPEEKSLIYMHEVTDIKINLVSGSDGNYFLSTDNSILWYKPEIASTVNYLNVVNTQVITYCKEESALFVANAGTLAKYYLPSQSPEIIYQSAEPVKDILLLYNK